jgi:hypothetical protein
MTQSVAVAMQIQKRIVVMSIFAMLLVEVLFFISFASKIRKNFRKGTKRWLDCL